jgi:putative anti-repressor protein, antA/antB family
MRFSPKLAKTPTEALKEYTLTLDMTKELSMVEKTEKGKQACRYFIEMEKIALQAKLLLVNNNNKDLQLELFDLIRANLLKGDLIAVSKFYFSISKFSRLIYLHSEI